MLPQIAHEQKTPNPLPPASFSARRTADESAMIWV